MIKVKVKDRRETRKKNRKRITSDFLCYRCKNTSNSYSSLIFIHIISVNPYNFNHQIPETNFSFLSPSCKNAKKLFPR